MVAVGALLAVYARLTEDEELVGVSGVCWGTVVVVRARLTADGELIGVSRGCLGAMVAVVDEQIMISLYGMDQTVQSSWRISKWTIDK